MSGGRWKRKDGEERDDTPYPKKPFKSSSSSAAAAATDDDDDNSDSVVVCEISKNRRVSVRNWQGKVWVDIREFYQKDGNTLPGKKGISMSVDQWNVLKDHAEEIDKVLAES